MGNKMNNLLNLELENNEAKLLASPYQNINDRKEIYLKYLIISALKANANIVDIDDALFYSRKFYSLTRLFDFYVNNNVFDLIIVKPNSNELLFETVQDDIHSNIYGYTVARISEDFKTAEIMGYFLSKDFKTVINGNKINTNALLAVDNFENIEILDSQMSLNDVSDRFFELVSMFIDEDIDESGLSELACLLYNSTELREVFAQIGKFEEICEGTKKYPELLNDNLLSVFSGEMADEILETQNIETTQDEYQLNDLNSLIEDTPQEITDTDEIDISNDLPELWDESEIENENSQVENDSEESIQQGAEIEDLSLDSITTETTPDENLLLQEEPFDIDLFSDSTTEEEDSIEEKTTIQAEPSLEESTDDILFNLEEIAQDETSEPLNNETILDDIALGFSQNSELDELSEQENEQIETPIREETLDLPSLEDSEQELSLIDSSTNDLPLETTNEQIGLLEDLPEENNSLDDEFNLSLEDDPLIKTQNNEQPSTTNQSRLSAELASLSLKLEDEEEETPVKQEDLQEIEIIEEEKEDFLDDLTIVEEKVLDLEFETEPQHEVIRATEDDTVGAEVLSDELMELLGNDNGVSDLTVDDKELYAILGAEPQKQTAGEAQIIDLSSIEDSSQDTTQEQSTQLETSIHKLNQAVQHKPSGISLTEENPSTEKEENGELQPQSSDLRLLYAQAGQTDIPNTDEQNGMPIGYQNISTSKNKKSNKKLVAIVALALLLLAGAGTMLNSSKNSDNDYSISAQDNELANDMPAPKQIEHKAPTKPAGKQETTDNYEDDEDLLATQKTSVADRKIETSLSNQAGAAPVILKAVAWQVPSSISKDAIFNKYLQIAGKNIKMNLATDLLDTDDFAYNNKIKISMTVKNNAPVKNIKVVESSGSKNVDDIVLQSIKQTLKYINTPVMSEDKGDREVILVISI